MPGDISKNFFLGIPLKKKGELGSPKNEKEDYMQWIILLWELIVLTALVCSFIK